MAYSDCRPRRPPLRQRQRQHQRRRLLHAVDVVSSLKMMARMRTMMIMMAVVFVLVLVERQEVPVQVAAFSFSLSSSSSSSSSSASFYSSQSSRKIKTAKRISGDLFSFSSMSLSMSQQQQQQQQPSFILHVDDSTTLTTGTLVLPPMVSVPCTITATTATATTDVSSLTEIIKPPNVDELYDWYIDVRKETDADPSWGVVWPTAIALGNYLLLNPTLVQNKNVIELGSGLSVCGLLAASIGANNVMVSDREQFALHCALSSAACNKISNNVFQGVILDWCDTQNNAELDNTADLILASDVLYDMETVDAFANVCQRLLVSLNTSTSTSTTTSNNNNKNGTAAATATAITSTILVTDPKIERTIGARERFKDTLFKLLNNNDDDNNNDDNDHKNNSGVVTEIEIEEIDLPLPCVTTNNDGSGSGSEDGSGRTLDGKDHTKRMKEETVLIRCTIRTTTTTTTAT